MGTTENLPSLKYIDMLTMSYHSELWGTMLAAVIDAANNANKQSIQQAEDLCLEAFMGSQEDYSNKSWLIVTFPSENNVCS